MYINEYGAQCHGQSISHVGGPGSIPGAGNNKIIWQLVQGTIQIRHPNWSKTEVSYTIAYYGYISKRYL